MLIHKLNAIMIPEILLNTFSFLPWSDIISCMQVCQGWIGPATVNLYRDVDFGLFAKVLGLPFTYEDSDPTKRQLVRDSIFRFICSIPNMSCEWK